ncbi:DUF6607 family protein [Leptobacterium sp. I13]|uniref:DUF6607 family protein n=1 Tax=Leptobacterium meishanense TaxID=3128904 RepID=UPI0030EB3C42
MKQIAVFFTVLMLISLNINAQVKKRKDQEAIKKMCGCYKVGFNFAETFNYAKDSTYQPSKVKHSRGLEWVQLVEDKENKIVIQHLLIVGNSAKPYIVKHWRQDWLYENTDFYMYDSNNKWDYVSKPKNEIVGQWTQKVYQVDDSPRYEGSATWVHVDGKSYWENTTDAPLPRREFTKRNDYNVTIRRNRHEITNEGWVHNQDNDKVIRKAGKEDFVLAQEKGYNTYVKVADSKCQAAQDWWEEHKLFWRSVRNNWEQIFSRKKELELKMKVEGKRLYEYLFDLELTSKSEKIEKVVNKFVK